MSLEIAIKELTTAINILADRYGLPRASTVTIDQEEFVPSGADGNRIGVGADENSAAAVLQQVDAPAALKRRGRPTGSKNRKAAAIATTGTNAPDNHTQTTVVDAGVVTVEPVAPPAAVPPFPDVAPEPAPEAPTLPVSPADPPVPIPVTAPPVLPTDPPEAEGPVTHDTIRIEARHLVARGDTPVLQKWLKDLFDVEAISMIPEDRLGEALASIKALL